MIERYADIRADAARQARDMEHRLAAMRVDGDVNGDVRKLEALYAAPPALGAAAARRADLVVLGSPGKSAADVAIAHAYFAGLLLESGRPVVIMPEGRKVVDVVIVDFRYRPAFHHAVATVEGRRQFASYRVLRLTPKLVR